ncbi:transposase [Escherichia coli]|nr:transposase [Escherichia coli]
MGTPRFTPEFKEEAVRQITERGYSVAEVSDRLGVSAHSLYKWLRAIKPDNSEQHARDLLEAKSEILKLRAQLKRTEEKRDILKKAARHFAREPDCSTALSMSTALYGV